MKIVTVIGARPQFIKATVVSRQLRKKKHFKEIIVHTGQHYDDNMSEIFFKELGIPKPSYNLGIGSDYQGAQAGRMLEAVENVLLKEKPGCVLVYGDTNSTLAGALAAAKLHIPIAHVEAGLRSFNRDMPEEINRVVADAVSDILFAPTKTAVNNLLREGIDRTRIKLVGDVMYDVALYYGQIAEHRNSILKSLGLTKKDYILSTIHRAENTDNQVRLRAIIGGLNEVAKNIRVILPLHPRTRSYLRKFKISTGNINIIDPVGYLDMIILEKDTRLIATDSGGVQKEAFFYKVPCVTLRTETEWVELVELGWNYVAPPHNAREIAKAIINNLNHKGKHSLPYGRGNSAELIVRYLEEKIGRN